MRGDDIFSQGKKARLEASALDAVFSNKKILFLTKSIGFKTKNATGPNDGLNDVSGSEISSCILEFKRMRARVGEVMKSGLVRQPEAGVGEVMRSGLVRQPKACVGEVMTSGLVRQPEACVGEVMKSGLARQPQACVGEMMKSGLVRQPPNPNRKRMKPNPTNSFGERSLKVTLTSTWEGKTFSREYTPSVDNCKINVQKTRYGVVVGVPMLYIRINKKTIERAKNETTVLTQKFRGSTEVASMEIKFV